MLSLHLRANPRETVVGWYATALPEPTGGSKCIADTSSLIHEFYAGECDDDPIHLVVDTSLDTDEMALRAYKSIPVTVKGEALANVFHEIRLAMKSSESERICIDRMIGASSTPVGASTITSYSARRRLTAFCCQRSGTVKSVLRASTGRGSTENSWV